LHHQQQDHHHHHHHVYYVVLEAQLIRSGWQVGLKKYFFPVNFNGLGIVLPFQTSHITFVIVYDHQIQNPPLDNNSNKNPYRQA
jgi:hypothetical protein